MGWWQIVLLILGSIITGILVGALVTYLVRRFVKKPLMIPLVMAKTGEELEARAIARREAEEAKAIARRKAEEAKTIARREAEEANEAKTIARREAEEANEAKTIARREAEEAKAIAKREAEEAKAIARRESEEAKRTEEVGIEEQLKLPAAALLAEVKNNCRTATEPLTDKLLPFQTDIWDAHQYETNKLPAKLRENLEQVYTDIRLANSIVWVSTEFNRRSRSLDEHYQRLCTSIAERLDRIRPLIEQLGK